MKRRIVPLLISLVLASIAAIAVARRGGQQGDQSQQCLDMRRCKKGEKPPACCKPPPCTYFRQLEMKMSLQALFKSRRLQAEALRTAGGDPVAAAAELGRRVMAMARDGTIDRRLPACAGDATPDPPGLETRGDCARYDADGKLSEDQAHRKYATCGEFLQASYRHEDLHKERCETQGSQARAKLPMTEYADEEVAGYQREINSLRDELQAWYDACTATVDAPLRAKLVKDGVKVLKGGRR